MKRYEGAVAVVTGASSGIGRRVTLDLAARGATVVGLARREGLLEELRQELQAGSPKSETLTCDVADVGQFEARLGDVEERHGRIDVLINNAGIEEPTPVTEPGASLEPYQRILATNFFGVVAGTLAVMPRMLVRGSGTIVNVSSDVVRAPEPRESAYAASKAAVSAFTESIAHEVADRGVHVHVLYPAWVPTAMGMSGAEDGGTLPPKLVRRSEEQVSQLLLERMGGARVEINAAWVPLLAPISRTLLPRVYQRAMRQRRGA